MESDAMSVVDYYIPRLIRLSSEPGENLTNLPDSLTGRVLYGTLVMGDHSDSLISIVLQEAYNRNSAFLFVDKNNNEDLSDDGMLQTTPGKGAYWTWSDLVDVQYDGFVNTVPYPVTFYRYRNKLPDMLIAYRDGFRRGEVVIADSSYQIALFDDDLNGKFNERGKTALVVDLDRDGVLDGSSGSDEYFDAFAPVAFGGDVYHVSKISVSGDEMVFSRVDTTFSPDEPLLIDKAAPSFSAYDLDGKVIDLDDFVNKVVLLDFWATWCKPWQSELDVLQRIHNRYHHRGLEIIGVSLDYSMEILQQYLADNNLPWPQIANGLGWETPLVDLYRIDALPARILIDRKGKLRYKNLHGNTLESQIVELLNE
jgi:peroxiredoxin